VESRNTSKVPGEHTPVPTKVGTSPLAKGIPSGQEGNLDCAHKRIIAQPI